MFTFYVCNIDNHLALIWRYLSHLSDKASGKIWTNARFMRDFVRSHPEYNKDSIVTNKMTYDLLMAMDKIQKDEKNINEHLSKVPEYSGWAITNSWLMQNVWNINIC